MNALNQLSWRALLVLLAGISLLSLGMPTPAASAPGGWQPLGPDGGSVYQLAYDDPFHPRTIYAVAGLGGLYRSQDGGGHWEPIDVGMENVSITAVGVMPHDTATLFAGLEGMGVRMSMDGGVTWHRTDLDDVTVQKFVFDPQNPLVIYALADLVLYRSINRGWNWDIVPGVYSVRALIIHPQQPQILYAGTGDGVFKSWDGGCMWQEIGLPGDEIWSLAVDPQSPETIYAGTWDGKLFFNENGGQVWQPIPLPVRSHIHTIIIEHGTSHSTLWVASDFKLLRSQDGGGTWQAIGEALEPRRIQSLLLENATSFFVATDTGIFKSADDGQTWRSTHQGIIHTAATTLTISPYDSRYLLIAIQSYQWSKEILKSVDGGHSWQPIYQTPDDTFSVALSFHPTNPDIIFVGSDNGIAKSMDGGLTWRMVNDGLSSSPITVLRIHPATPDIVYAGTRDRGVFKSEDGGESWHQTGLKRQWVKDLALAPGNPQIIYAGISCSCSHDVCHSLYRSDDGGETWHETAHLGYTRVSGISVAVSALSPDIVYVGTLRYGLFKSEDGGESWRHLELDERAVGNLVIHPEHPQWLFASGPHYGLSISQDGGESWTPFNPGLGIFMPDFSVAPAAQDASFTYALYAATNGRGIFVYRDAALTWLPMMLRKP